MAGDKHYGTDNEEAINDHVQRQEVVLEHFGGREGAGEDPERAVDP